MIGYYIVLSMVVVACITVLIYVFHMRDPASTNQSQENQHDA